MSLYDGLHLFDQFGPIAGLVAGGLLVLLVANRSRAMSIVSGLAARAAGLVVGIFAVWAMVFWGPVRWLAGRFVPTRLLIRTSEGLLALAGRLSSNPLLQGKRHETAKWMWSPAKFSFLYRNVPEDIRRPLFEDGKLIGGVPITWMTDRYVTATVTQTAAASAGLVAAVIFLPPVLYLVGPALWSLGEIVVDAFSLERPILERWPGDNPVRLGAFDWYLHILGVAARLLWLVLQYFALALAKWALVAIGLSLIVGPSIIYAWRAAKGAKYQQMTKDANVRWTFRAETREVLTRTYNHQVELADGYLRESPLFRIGEATGTLRLRGDLTAPAPGQSICLDQDALFQHILVLGGTGEGKTSGVLRPLMRQVLPITKFGMYVCDAKGVLWRDAQSIATQVGRGDDVVVIGTGPGQRGVDPVAELTPTQVVSVLRSVLRQIGGSGGQSFWPDMAANILRHIFTVARSYALTPEGKNATVKNGLNPYSLWWVYQSVLNEAGLEATINRIQTASAALRTRIASCTLPLAEKQALEAEHAALMPSDLNASISYLSGPWKQMAAQTKSGIVAYISQLLDGFSGTPVLRERFACGQPNDAVRLSAALEGKIVLNALSSIEDGLPARLVIMLLKTTLYREARRREAAWKTETPPRSPQSAPCVVVMDEVQEIATADPTSGLSDATFWNVARSTGLAGIFATQTIAALEQSMGKEAAANFLQQARSKIFFRSEDQPTVNYACWCAGKFERDRVYDDGLFESLEFQELLTSEALLEPIDESDAPRVGPGYFFSIARHMLAGAQQRWDLPSKSAFAGTSGPSADRETQWRDQDLESRYRTQGTEDKDALIPADILSMGRWHAYAHIQRAGTMRQDLMVVRHEYE